MDTSDAREQIIVRETSRTTIVLVLIATFGLIIATFVPAVLKRLAPLGEGRVNLIVFCSIFVLAIGGAAIGVGRLRPRDLGLRAGKLAEAIAVVGCVWILLQVAHAVTGLIGNGSLQLDDALRRFGLVDRLLWFAVMLFGTALTEETIFRGFFYPQLYLKCRGSQRRRFWVAATAAAILFGLFHVPRHIVFSGMSTDVLAVRVLMHAAGGILATAIYLRTRNLLIVIGLHGIENAPIRLFDSRVPSEALLLVELLLLVTWPWLMKRSAHRGLATIVRAERREDATGGQIGAAV